MLGTRSDRRISIWLILLTPCLWLALIAAQAMFGPFDGYVPIHINAPGALISSGPVIADNLLHFARPLLTLRTVRLGYSLLLTAVPLLSIWLIARNLGTEGTFGTRPMRRLCIAVVAFLAVLTIGDLPYLSNDIYLYRAQGQMLFTWGCSPYAATPAECLPGDVLKNVPWVNQNSPYGPLALAIFVAASSLPGGIVLDFWLLKVMLTLPWLIMLVYIHSSRLFGVGRRMLWFAWIGLNPVLVLEVCQNGHLEGWLGLLLLFLVLTLLRVSYGRVLVAGILLGLACAIKLSVVVVAPVILMWLVSAPQMNRRPSGETVLLLLLFVMPMLATVAVLYLPFWQGVHTFAGIQQESEKTLRSLYSVLRHHFGMPPTWILGSSILGDICAGVAGMLICAKRRSLTDGLLICLLVQAILGRTFLQPWYFCPPIMLAPLLGMTARRKHEKISLVQRLDAAEIGLLRVLLVISASAIAGGYAVLFLARGRSPQAQSLSFVCMIVPPLIVWIFGFVTSRVHLGPPTNTEEAAAVDADEPRH